MKKKLLITMGCSFTEGEGCYDPELIKQYPNLDRETIETIKLKSRDRWHAGGWPPILQQDLNYDRLINIGHRGAGESFQLKRFIEEFSSKDLTEEYDVLVVLLVTPVNRLSFYSNGTLRNVHLNATHAHPTNRRMAWAYAELINDIDLDTCLEQLFYIKALKEICNGKNYNLLVFPSGTRNSRLHDFLDIPENMGHFYAPKENIFPDLRDPNYHSILKCGHPNELGYTVIASNMIEIISKHASTLINNADQVQLEQEWRAPKKWTLPQLPRL